MTKLLILATMLFSSLFWGCKEVDPTKDILVGSWKGTDNSSIDLQSSGTFTGKDLPAKLFSHFVEKKYGNKFNGEGKWEIQRGQGRWIVLLKFDRLNAEADLKGDYQIMLSRTGKLENGNDWYLFLWKEEEGGERFVFNKS